MLLAEETKYSGWMCRGSSDPAFSTQLGEKAHQEKQPFKVRLNREEAAAKARPVMLACPPQDALYLHCSFLLRTAFYLRLHSSKSAVPVAPQMTQWAEGAEGFLSPGWCTCLEGAVQQPY